MTGKMRVYEVAKEVGVPNKELIAKIRALGLEINNHMSSLSPDDVVRVKRSLEKERLANTETKRLSSTVLRRRSKKSAGSGPVVRRSAASTETESSPPAVTPPSPPKAEVASKPTVRKRPAPAAVSEPPKVSPPVAASPPPPPPEPVVEAKPPSKPEVAPPVEPAPVAEKPPEPVRAPAPEAPSPAVAKVAKAAPAPKAPTPPVAAESVSVKPPVEAPSVPADESNPSQKTPVFVDGPPVVALPRRKGAPQIVEMTPRAKTKAPAAKAKSKAAPEPELSPRDRFEAELARARSRVEEREAEKKPPSEPTPDEPPRDPSRPAVGSIISLPVPRIKITERAPTRQPGAGQIRGRFAQQRGPARNRRSRDFGRKKQAPRRGTGKQTQITTPAEHKRVIRMEETIAMPELAKGMGVKANELLRKLWSMGMMGININASIDYETAQILATEFGYEVQNVAFKEDDVFVSRPDEDGELQERAPVVTVMGHVDHGKTSLLDYIRSAQVTKGEAGGITQHIAAYRVDAGDDYGDIVFLDTPGHEAFTEMRARGAQATDIVVLVVAADDGVMPQTLEAVNHAKDAKVPIIVAINKCDLPDGKPDRVKQQLGDHGLIPEEWGGDTLYIPISALTGEGIDRLLESITLQAELLELKANPDKPALGVVVEAKLDRNRGPMATVLVREGTLSVGHTVVAGEYFGKVRAMLNHKGKPVQIAGPATPVELLGLDGVPLAGEVLNVAEDEKKAKQVVEHRRQAKRKKELATTSKVSLENLMEKIHEGEVKELKVVLKADVQGSAEALKEALTKQSTDKVRVNVISAGVGGITESDVNLARAGGTIIVGFHVRPAGKSAKLAEQEGVKIYLYDVIYEALDEVRSAMAGLLAPIKKKRDVGSAEVRETFNIPKIGVIAGCMVKSGKLLRKSHLRVLRDSIQIHDGRCASLKRFKDDVGEVQSGYECGLMVDGFNDIQIGDIIEAYEIIEEAATL